MQTNACAHAHGNRDRPAYTRRKPLVFILFGLFVSGDVTSPFAGIQSPYVWASQLSLRCVPVHAQITTPLPACAYDPCLCLHVRLSLSLPLSLPLFLPRLTRAFVCKRRERERVCVLLTLPLFVPPPPASAWHMIFHIAPRYTGRARNATVEKRELGGGRKKNVCHQVGCSVTVVATLYYNSGWVVARVPTANSGLIKKMSGQGWKEVMKRREREKMENIAIHAATASVGR